MRFTGTAAAALCLANLASAGWQLSFYKKTTDARPFYSNGGDEGQGECYVITDKNGKATLSEEMFLSKFGNRPEQCGIWDIDTWAGASCGGKRSYSNRNVNYQVGPVNLTVAPYVPVKSFNITCHYGV